MPIIETVNLTKRYGELVALDALNLTIDEGDCFGFIGPNGAGKTTTIKILATLLKPSSGQAQVCGLTVGYQNRQIRPLIGYLPDFMGAYEKTSAISSTTLRLPTTTANGHVRIAAN
jgi:ABC-2 type transport system ATP-binding protein